MGDSNVSNVSVNICNEPRSNHIYIFFSFLGIEFINNWLSFFLWVFNPFVTLFGGNPAFLCFISHSPADVFCWPFEARHIFNTFMQRCCTGAMLQVFINLGDSMRRQFFFNFSLTHQFHRETEMSWIDAVAMIFSLRIASPAFRSTQNTGKGYYI